MFEEDMVAVSVEHNDSRALFRQAVYPDFFGMDSYEWIKPSEANRGAGQQGTTYGGDAAALEHPSGDQGQVELSSKPYLPPTEAQGDTTRPFGSVLEPPMQAL